MTGTPQQNITTEVKEIASKRGFDVAEYIVGIMSYNNIIDDAVENFKSN